MGLFGKSDYNIGLKGTPEEVRSRVQVSQPYAKKLKVLEGCLDAYKAERADNLRAFFESYLDHKRSLGEVKGMPTSVNEGFVVLLAEPLLNLAEKSTDPEKTLRGLTQGMTPFYKNVTLTLALLYARSAGAWPVARKFLEGQIDPDDTGYSGPVAKVRARAQLDTSWPPKASVVDGCLRAFDEGKPEHLKAFIGGYLEFKRSGGYIEQMRTQGMDEGIKNLFTKPVVRLLEKAKDPLETVHMLLTDLNDFYRQTALDLLLREASSETNSWFAAGALLDAGADPNAGGGRPLASAFNKGDEKIITLLYRYGADFDKIPAFAAKDCPQFETAAAEWKSKLSGKAIPVTPVNTSTPLPASAGKPPKKLEL